MVMSYADKDGTNAYPGVDRLAEDCRLSPAAVKRALAALTRSGWLVQIKRGRGRGPNKGGIRSVYALSTGQSTAQCRAHDSKVKGSLASVSAGSHGLTSEPTVSGPYQPSGSRTPEGGGPSGDIDQTGECPVPSGSPSEMSSISDDPLTSSPLCLDDPDDGDVPRSFETSAATKTRCPDCGSSGAHRETCPAWQDPWGG